MCLNIDLRCKSIWFIFLVFLDLESHSSIA